MRFESFIFDLYGTLADICTDENPAVFWEGAAAYAEGFGAQYSGEALRMEYLRLCADEVCRRNAEEPEVPEEFVEPELLNVFRRLLPEGAELPASLEALHTEHSGRLQTLILRTSAERAEAAAHEAGALYAEAVPLSLEEIFVYELGGDEYAVKEILL